MGAYFCDPEAVTSVMDEAQLRWLRHMCRSGEGLEEGLRETSRPPPGELRRAVASSLPPLRLEGISDISARGVDDSWDADPEVRAIPEDGG